MFLPSDMFVIIDLTCIECRNHVENDTHMLHAHHHTQTKIYACVLLMVKYLKPMA